MMIKQQGLVFIVVLLFMQIFMLFGLYRLESSFLDKKLSRGDWYKIQILPIADELLTTIEVAREAGVYSGVYRGFEYTGCVESVGSDPCVQRQQITLQVRSKIAAITLQSIYLSAHQSALISCQGRSDAVHLGRQSWRELLSNKELICPPTH